MKLKPNAGTIDVAEDIARQGALSLGHRLTPFTQGSDAHLRCAACVACGREVQFSLDNPLTSAVGSALSETCPMENS